jgi:hypothetical protein
MTTGSSGTRRRRGEQCFWKRWSRWCRGGNCVGSSSRTIPGRPTDDDRKNCIKMLRFYFLQRVVQSGGPGVEEALYDSATLRQFAGIDLGAEPVPHETTVCKFRYLLEEHHLGEEILGTVNLNLQAKRVRVTTGTIVDATLIHAPSSTKPASRAGDPEMHQMRKGKDWYFGMKAHVGGGHQDEDHPHGGRNSGPCFRCSDIARPAAWRRGAGVGRRSVSRPNRGDPRMCATSARFHPASLSLPRADRG